MTDFQSLIHLTLKELIEEKSKRDNVKFTGCQLAQALGIPRSIITKLTHQDQTKRVTNPKIDTLMKIVAFFKADGFDINVEKLLGISTKTINIRNQQAASQKHAITISAYSLDKMKKIGSIEVKIAKNHKDVIALYTNKDVPPFFKAGSIFIIDQTIPLEDDHLIAIKLAHCSEVQIKKYCIIKNKIVLKSLNGKEKDMTLMPTMQSEILGVVVQVNANT